MNDIDSGMTFTWAEAAQLIKFHNAEAARLREQAAKHENRATEIQKTCTSTTLTTVTPVRHS